MIYNTLMVQLDLDTPAEPRISFAWKLAERFEADLIGFAAAQPRHFVAAGDMAIDDGEYVRHQVHQIEERLNALKDEFEAVTGVSNRASWRGFVGEPTGLLATHARACDLVILGSGSHEVLPDRHRTVDPGGLILSAGRPVLVAADNWEPVHAKEVLVAWKDTREARRTIVDAMPFLVHAKNVVVATVEEDMGEEAADTAADVVRFLIRHGVKARSLMLGDDEGVGAALAETARDIGADLVVSGGFGHSRLREWAFGGVTRSLLREGGVHRLLSN